MPCSQRFVPRRSIAAAIMTIAMLLTACGSRERPSESRPSIATASARDTAICHADLRHEGVEFRALSDKDYGRGCGLSGTVQLLDIGVPVNNLTAIRCGEARAFANWIRNAVAPAAYQILGSELARVDSMGSYACRNVVGTANSKRRSGHAIANAVDIASFVLKDGRRISILDDWNASDPSTRRFMRTIHASACKRFGTVLSPDYNAAHRNHLHLEDDHANFCR